MIFSIAARNQVSKMLDAAIDGIQDIADQMADGHNPDYFISEEEEVCSSFLDLDAIAATLERCLLPPRQCLLDGVELFNATTR